VVTISHTAGVYLLGAVTFYASKHVVPEQLYPWLSLFSGLTIAVLGALLFIRRFGGVEDHHHGPGGHHHHHGLGGHTHSHSHDGLPEHTHEPNQPVSLRALIALGVSGGIIPCPAALVVLLTALSMHRVGFGLVLIVAFSIGLAAVLVAIGVLMVYAGRLMSRFKEEGPLIKRWLPLTSSAVMTLLGFGIAIQAVVPWIRR
jgi:ABC-type nickel/cobalt efflux system permease component RcnA